MRSYSRVALTVVSALIPFVASSAFASGYRLPSDAVNPTEESQCNQVYEQYRDVHRQLMLEGKRITRNADQTLKPASRAWVAAYDQAKQLFNQAGEVTHIGGEARNRCLQAVSAHRNRLAREQEAERRRQGEMSRQRSEAQSRAQQQGREAQEAQQRYQQNARALKEGIDALRGVNELRKDATEGVLNPKEFRQELLARSAERLGRLGQDALLRRQSPPADQDSAAQRDQRAIHDETVRLGSHVPRNPIAGSVSDAAMEELKRQNSQTLGRLDQLGRDIQRFGTEPVSPSSGASSFESRWSGTPNSPIPSRIADASATGPSSSSTRAGGFEQRWASTPEVSQPPTGATGRFASRWSASSGDSAQTSQSVPTPSSGSASPPRATTGGFEDRWGTSSPRSPSPSPGSPPSAYPSSSTGDRGSPPSTRPRIDNTQATKCIEFVEVPNSGGWFYNRCSRPVHFVAQKYADRDGNRPAGWFTGSSHTLAPGERKGIVLGTSQTVQWSACEGSDRNCVNTLERLDNDGNSRRREEFCGLLRPMGLTCQQAVSSPPRRPASPSYGNSWSGDRPPSGGAPRTYPSSPSRGGHQ